MLVYLRRGPDNTLKERFMIQEQTTAVVQHYLEELDGDGPAEPIVRALWTGRSIDSRCFAQPSIPGLPTIDATTSELAAR